MTTIHMKAFERSGSTCHDLIEMEWLCHIYEGYGSGPRCIWHMSWPYTCRFSECVVSATEDATKEHGHHVNTLLWHSLMEKFSAFRVRWYLHHKFIHLIFLSGPRHRDTGTVIAYLIALIFVDFRWQPFLPPVPPLGAASVFTKILLPLRYILAIIRTLLVLLLALVYVISVRGVCLILVKSFIHYFFHHLLIHLTPSAAHTSTASPRWTLTHIYSWAFRFVYSWHFLDFSRTSDQKERVSMTSLVLVTELIIFQNNRRALGKYERWNPNAGDIIVSNWTSWVDVLWLSIRSVSSFVSHNSADSLKCRQDSIQSLFCQSQTRRLFLNTTRRLARQRPSNTRPDVVLALAQRTYNLRLQPPYLASQYLGFR